MTKPLSGAEYLARALDGYGVSDVFFMEAILRRTLLQLEKLGVRRIMGALGERSRVHGRWLCACIG